MGLIKCNLINKNFGFSLVEVIVALGLLSIVGFTSSALLYSQLKTQKEIDIKTELDSLQSLTRMVVSSPYSCKGNFISSKVSSFPLKIPVESIQIFDETGVSKSIEIEKNKKKGNLFINDSYLQIQQKLGPNTYLAEFVIDAQSFDIKSTVDNNTSLRRKALRIPLRITTNASNNIVDCSDLSVSAINQQICSDIQGTYNMTTGKCDITQKINEAVTTAVTNTLASIGSCPSGQAFQGYSSNGSRICTPLNSGTSASTQPPSPSPSAPSTGPTVTSTSEECFTSVWAMGYMGATSTYQCVDKLTGTVCTYGSTGKSCTKYSNWPGGDINDWRCMGSPPGGEATVWTPGGKCLNTKNGVFYYPIYMKQNYSFDNEGNIYYPIAPYSWQARNY